MKHNNDSLGPPWRLCVALLVFWTGLAQGDDPVFSGPQPGEKTTPFRVLELTGPGEGKERDPIAENAGAPTALVFVHGIERSLVPLLRVVDQYGAERQDRLKTEIVFLSADRLSGEQRVKAAAGSLKLQSRVGFSLDGAEGPGNYGLNGQCLMTIVAARDNQVTTNFALVQPGIADAPAVILGLARACGDATPPTVEELNRRQLARSGAGRDRERMMKPGETGRRPGPGAESFDLSKLDLNSEAGLREAVRALIAEVSRLRTELADLRAKSGAGANTGTERAKEDYPGAVPTDEKLQGLLRQFIRPTNDEATVDRLLAEIESYVKGNPDLTRQAIDGWTRILHFGERYGTAYARKGGQELLERLKKQ
jgi:hypothetical protein